MSAATATATALAPAPATGDAASSAARLGVMIGERRWLVDLADAGEIVPVPGIVPVPLTRDWFRGVVNLRGALHTVVDLARFSGGTSTAVDKDARLLALAPRLQFNATVLVSRMLGLRSTASMTRDERAPAAGEAGTPTWVGPTWLDETGTAWQELSLARLVHDERFQLVGR